MQPETEQPLPYWRLSSFYFCYFALLGAIVPFWSLYLDFLGMTAGQIGILMAILMGTRVIAPNIWGWLADRSGRRVVIIRGGAFLTLVVFCTAFWAKDFWSLALMMFGFTFFWNAVLPQFEVITIKALGARKNRYSQIRLWGSVGFICSVVGLGALFDYFSIELLVPVMWGLIVSIWLATLAISRRDEIQARVQSGEFLKTALQPAVLSFVAINLIVQLSHGPYYTFFSIYMTDFGYSNTQIGLLWALGVVAEVAVFLVMHRWLDRFGLRNMMLFSLALCVLRWLLIGIYPDQLWILLGAQLMHAVTFGFVHATSIALVHHFFSEGAHGQGQALYSSAGFGLGGALGAYLSGVLWTAIGGSQTFLLAALVCVLGFVIAWFGLKLNTAENRQD